MERNHVKGVLFLSSLVCIVGLILLFFSVHFGTSLAENWLINEVEVDTSIYLIVLETYVNSFLITGGIMLGMGLLMVSIAYFKMNN